MHDEKGKMPEPGSNPRESSLDELTRLIKIHPDRPTIIQDGVVQTKEDFKDLPLPGEYQLPKKQEEK